MIHTTDVLPYICGKLDGAAVECHPFPHLVIQDFWPQWFYALLMTDLPQGEDWMQRGMYGGGKTQMASYPAMSPNWRRAVDVLESDVFAACLSAKWDLQPGVSRCLLHRDTHGYSISPHTDAVAKRAAYVLYCPPPEDSKAMGGRCNYLGTHLLIPNIYTAADKWGDTHQPWFNFSVEKTVPYQANTLVSWPRSDTSFHAVDCHIMPGSGIEARYTARGFVFDPDVPLPYIFQEDARERAASDDR